MSEWALRHAEPPRPGHIYYGAVLMRLCGYTSCGPMWVDVAKFTDADMARQVLADLQALEGADDETV